MTATPGTVRGDGETRPRPLIDPDPDGIGRVEALRRLLALADREPPSALTPHWIVRLRAAWAAWRRA